MVDKVRLSLGTAIQLGLEKGTKDPHFTTAFLMTYNKGKCSANCAFCPQARESSSSSDKLSRITWPQYEFVVILDRLRIADEFKRICIQTINYAGVLDDVLEIVVQLRKSSNIPISVAIHPLDHANLERLKESGVSSIGIALDASTPILFEKVKGKDRKSAYRWSLHIEGLKNALDVFGKGNVTTHLIIGLGETEKDAADFMFQMNSMGINVGLFAFTSIKGTYFEHNKSPELSSYRRIQILRYLISKDELTKDQVVAHESGKVSLRIDKAYMLDLLSTGEAFQVTGCKNCNRPYYNETPRGPMYNYPQPLSPAQTKAAISESRLV